jgi:hypothetical protein
MKYLVNEVLYIPDAAQANKRDPRSQDSTFPVNLIEYPTLDEVCVAIKRYKIDGFGGVSDRSAGGDVSSAGSALAFATYQEAHSN